MKRVVRLAGVVALATLAACETTGDPRQGGLFGWSESKARERQTQKQSHLAGAEAELTREAEHGEALQARNAATERNLTAAENLRVRTEERLRAQQTRLLAKTDRLEAESPTATTASRARSYRLKVNTIAAQTSLTPQQRAERLHALEAEIDAALERVVNFLGR
jgi:hypothetical protein